MNKPVPGKTGIGAMDVTATQCKPRVGSEAGGGSDVEGL